MKRHDWNHSEATSICKSCNKSINIWDDDYVDVIYSNDCPEIVTYEVHIEDIRDFVSVLQKQNIQDNIYDKQREEVFV